MVRSFMWRQVLQAVDGLTPAAQNLFVRFYLVGDSLDTLAAESGRSMHATGEALRRARAAILRRLEREGTTTDDLLGGV